jgi:hypothetical protein
MTITPPSSPVTDRPEADAARLQRVGGAAALLAAGTFGYGIVLFGTTLADYTDPDATAADSVDFLIGHQGALLSWYVGIFLVFGAVPVPLALALRQRFEDRTPGLANAGMVFAAIWATLMFATGMVSNIGVEAVADLAETDPGSAATVWSAIDTVTNGLGGGNEIVGGIWIALVWIAGMLTARLLRLPPLAGHRGYAARLVRAVGLGRYCCSQATGVW